MENKEETIMEKFLNEIKGKNKDELLLYMQRLGKQEQKYNSKLKRIKKKLRIMKEVVDKIESDEWKEQVSRMND